MEHPISDLSLVRFSKGTASKEENREIVAHLVKGCRHCSRRLRELGPPPVPAGAYDEALERFSDGLAKTLEVAAEKAIAEGNVLPWQAVRPHTDRKRG